MILISACLAGAACRYDGKAQTCPMFLEKLTAGETLPLCPEMAGGLPVPRTPSEIVGGDGADVLDGRARVVNRDGEDVTEAFLRGAKLAVALCRRYGIREAVLKSGSPSCGCGCIYDGSFTGGKRPGDGVTCAALKRAGVRVRTEYSQRREE